MQLNEAIGLISTRPEYEKIETPLLAEFVYAVLAVAQDGGHVTDGTDCRRNPDVISVGGK